MGFDIEPKQFIKLFVDNGILSFEAGNAEISIPVIRSYMLAKGLAALGVTGLEYFDFRGELLDVSTFDLYCEFCDDDGIYEIISGLLDSSIDYFQGKIDSHQSVVKDGQFRSELLAKSIQMSKFSKDISSKAADLIEVTSLVSEKQAKLDVQYQIAQSRAAKSVDLSDMARFKNEHAAVLQYQAATIMLGSAAEKMSDAFKLSFISKILKLGSLMATDLLTLFAKLDVNATVKEVLNRIEADEAVTFDTPESKSEFDEFVRANVEMWQFKLAAHPLLVLISLLCEAGRTNVLLSPIKRTKTNDKLAEFMRSTWAFDLDPVSQRRGPKDLSKALGTSLFLRTIFGISMVNRSYWYQHGRQRREAVARGIDEMFKPLSLTNNLNIDDHEVN